MVRHWDIWGLTQLARRRRLGIAVAGTVCVVAASLCVFVSCGRGAKNQIGTSSQVGELRVESDYAGESSGGSSGGDASLGDSSQPKPAKIVPLEAAIDEIASFTSPALAASPGDAPADPDVLALLRTELIRLLTERFGDTSRIVATPPAGDAGLVSDLAFDAESGTLSWSYVNLGDYDLNGEVGVSDITSIATHFLALTNDGVGDDALEAWIDGNADGEVGIPDITSIANHYLAQVAAYRILTCDISVGEFTAIGEPVPFGEPNVFPKRYSVPVPSGESNFIRIEPLDAEGNAGARSDAVELAIAPEIIGVGPASGIVGTEVQFVIQVTGSKPMSYSWNFGGAGAPNESTQESPVIQLDYSEGSYAGSVTVSNARGSDTFNFTFEITEVPETPRIYEVVPTRGFSGEEVTFMASVFGMPSTAYAWDFDGGTIPPKSNDVSPTVILGEPGDYNAKLLVVNEAGYDMYEFTLIVDTLAGPPEIKGVRPAGEISGPTATFTADLRGTEPFTYYWDFGSGAIPNVSYDASPEITPRAAGTYNAVLVVTNAYGYDVFNWDMVVAPDWRVLRLDSDEAIGDDPSLALDSNDYAHIAYYDATNDDLIYANIAASTFNSLTVDSSGDVGQTPSIAVDSNDLPHIAYREGGQVQDLKYASYDGYSWRVETVDSEGNVGGYASIATDSANHPHISYYDSTNSNLKHAYFDGVQWNTETVDNQNIVGQYSSIAVDRNDGVHISYRDGTDGDLKYAFNDGTGWNIMVVDTEGNTGAFTCIALDSFDRPCISYAYYWNPNTLKYAFYTGAYWIYAETSPAYMISTYTSLDLDSADNPHITACAIGWTIYTHYSNNRWRLIDLPSPDFVSTSWYKSSIKLDSRGSPHLAANTFYTNDLYYIWQEPAVE